MRPIERRYRILGRSVALACDRADFVRLFDRNYSLFRRPMSPPSAPRRPHLRIELRLRAVPPSLQVQLSSPPGPPLHSVSPTPPPIALPSVHQGFVYNLVQREIFRTLPDFVFLHAAVAVQGGRALLLAGPSGAGKTTLLLQLAKAGFSVFSDEFAPVNLTTGLVHPFPRTISVRRDRDDPIARKSSSSYAVLRALRRRPVPIGLIVFLETASPSSTPRGYSVLIETAASKRFVKDIGPAAHKVVHVAGTAYTAVLFPPLSDRPSRVRVIKAMNAHRHAVLDIYHKRDQRGVFASTPDIRPLSPSEAAGRFLSNLIDSSNPLAAERPGAAFFRTCRILRKAVCLGVRPGTPRDTAAALAAIWSHKQAGANEGGGVIR